MRCSRQTNYSYGRLECAWGYLWQGKRHATVLNFTYNTSAKVPALYPITDAIRAMPKPTTERVGGSDAM